MSDSDRSVLVIAYYFPPMGLSGVQRTLKFVKFLPLFGWKPTVLTVEPGGYYAFDPSLLREAEEAGVEVVRTRSRDVNSLFRKRSVVKTPSERKRRVLQFLGDTFFIPDTKIGWKRRAVRVGMKLMRNRRFNLIFATAPPQTDFLIGLSLHRRTRVPLVVEYRDAWLDFPFKYYPTPLHRYLHYRLEKKVLRKADRIVVTHRRFKEDILRRYKFLGYQDVTIVSQGYDPEDFERHPHERRHARRRLTIAHAGTFYGGRTPTVLLNALHDLFREMPAMRGRIEVNFLGTVRNEDEALVRKLGLQHDVVFSGYREHRECVRALAAADVLWFVNDNDRSSPGKLYEYFGARKTILASVVEGYTQNLIRESQGAVVVPLRDVDAHRKALRHLVELFEQKKLPVVSQEFAERFNRRFLTAELVRVFESLMDLDSHSIRKVDGRSR